MRAFLLLFFIGAVCTSTAQPLLEGLVSLKPTTLLEDSDSLMRFSGDVFVNEVHEVHGKKIRYHKDSAWINCFNCTYTYWGEDGKQQMPDINFSLNLESKEVHLEFLKSSTSIDLDDYNARIFFRENTFPVTSREAGYAKPDYDGRFLKFRKSMLVYPYRLDSMVIEADSMAADMKKNLVFISGNGVIGLNNSSLTLDSNGAFLSPKGEFSKLRNVWVWYVGNQSMWFITRSNVKVTWEGLYEGTGRLVMHHKQYIDGVRFKTNFSNGAFNLTANGKIRKSQGFKFPDGRIFWGEFALSAFQRGATFKGKVREANGDVLKFSGFLQLQ